MSTNKSERLASHEQPANATATTPGGKEPKGKKSNIPQPKGGAASASRLVGGEALTDAEMPADDVAPPAAAKLQPAIVPAVVPTLTSLAKAAADVSEARAAAAEAPGASAGVAPDANRGKSASEGGPADVVSVVPKLSDHRTSSRASSVSPAPKVAKAAAAASGAAPASKTETRAPKKSAAVAFDPNGKFDVKYLNPTPEGNPMWHPSSLQARRIAASYVGFSLGLSRPRWLTHPVAGTRTPDQEVVFLRYRQIAGILEHPGTKATIELLSRPEHAELKKALDPRYLQAGSYVPRPRAPKAQDDGSDEEFFDEHGNSITLSAKAKAKVDKKSGAAAATGGKEAGGKQDAKPLKAGKTAKGARSQQPGEAPGSARADGVAAEDAPVRPSDAITTQCLFLIPPETSHSPDGGAKIGDFVRYTDHGLCAREILSRLLPAAIVSAMSTPYPIQKAVTLGAPSKDGAVEEALGVLGNGGPSLTSLLALVARGASLLGGVCLLPATKTLVAGCESAIDDGVLGRGAVVVGVDDAVHELFAGTKFATSRAVFLSDANLPAILAVVGKTFVGVRLSLLERARGRTIVAECDSEPALGLYSAANGPLMWRNLNESYEPAWGDALRSTSSLSHPAFGDSHAVAEAIRELLAYTEIVPTITLGAPLGGKFSARFMSRRICVSAATLVAEARFSAHLVLDAAGSCFLRL